jgi:hypothetical protein
MFGHGCFGRDELVVCFLGGWPTDSPQKMAAPENGSTPQRRRSVGEEFRFEWMDPD